MLTHSRYVSQPPDRQTLRAEHVAATRAAILRAGKQLFGDHGYADTSLDDLAAAARVTKGAIYHHFDSKRALFRAVYDEVEAEAQAATAAIGPDASPIDVIKANADAYLDAVLDPAVQRITLIDAPAVLGPSPDGPPEAQPGHVLLREFVRHAVAEDVLAPLDPDAVAHLVRGSCLQAALYIATSSTPDAARRGVGAVLDAMLDGLASGSRMTRSDATTDPGSPVSTKPRRR